MFDDRHNVGEPQWLERLRRFGERLLPANPKRACNTVVSDLCDGSWFSTEIVSLIGQLEQRQDDDRSVRVPALDLLKTLRPRLQRHLVKRPFSGGTWPIDEQGWADEAVASGQSSRMPIHRIVVSSGLSAGPHWTNLPAAEGEEFWETAPVTESPRADLGQRFLQQRFVEASVPEESFSVELDGPSGTSGDMPANPKTKPYPRTCAECGAVAVQPTEIVYDAQVRHDGRAHRFQVPRLVIDKCQRCGEELFTNRTNDQITAVLRESLGLLGPEHISCLLVEQHLSEAGLARRLGLPTETVSHWMNGLAMQTRAQDNSIRLVLGLPERTDGTLSGFGRTVDGRIPG